MIENPVDWGGRRNAKRRVNKDLPLVELNLPERETKTSSCSAYIVDFSSRGFGLELGTALPLGGQVRFALGLAYGTVSGIAEVRWVSETNAGYRCGLEILRIGWWQALLLKAALGAGIFSPKNSLAALD